MHGGNIGDFYLNFLLMGLIEFPSILASIYLMDKIGRKKTQLLWMLSGGTACLCTIFTVLYGGESKNNAYYILQFTWNESIEVKPML